jgi:hypothetical protein
MGTGMEALRGDVMTSNSQFDTDAKGAGQQGR